MQDATEAVVEIDGSHITEFLKDDANFRKYMQTKFAELDVHGSGTLTKKDMRPIVEEIVQLLVCSCPHSLGSKGVRVSQHVPFNCNACVIV